MHQNSTFKLVKYHAATQLPTSKKTEMTLCHSSAHVSSGNTDEAHSNLCKTLLQLFTADWIIDRLLLADCQDFPKDMSNLPSQSLKDVSIFDKHCFIYLQTKTSVFRII